MDRNNTAECAAGGASAASCGSRRRSCGARRYLGSQVDRWVAARVEALSALLVFGAASLAILSRGAIPASVLGLAVSYAINCTGSMQWFVRCTAQMESQVCVAAAWGERRDRRGGGHGRRCHAWSACCTTAACSPRRLCELTAATRRRCARARAHRATAPLTRAARRGPAQFTDDAELRAHRRRAEGSVAVLTSATARVASGVALVAPPPDWPRAGTVVYEDVVMAYRLGLEPVLRGVAFAVRDREKVRARGVGCGHGAGMMWRGWEQIGVVGRTGAGKSSLMLSLFRIAEVTSGRILVDGVRSWHTPVLG